MKDEDPGKNEEAEKDAPAGKAPSGGPDSGPENDAAEEELSRLATAGGRTADRSGGLAFLALLVLVLAGLHFHFASGGYAAQDLDADLRRHAELSLAAHRENPNLAVVADWPVRLYRSGRRDVALYLVAAAVAACLWGLSVRSRARRDAALVHENCRREIESLKARLALLEGVPDADGSVIEGGEKSL